MFKVYRVYILFLILFFRRLKGEGTPGAEKGGVIRHWGVLAGKVLKRSHRHALGSIRPAIPPKAAFGRTTRTKSDGFA